MAQGKTIVDTQSLDTAASQVTAKADEYNKEYLGLFATVQALEEAWAGTDNVAFTNQIEGFRDDFQRMEQLMRDYANYLTKSARTYREAQAELAADAKKLSQGS